MTTARLRTAALAVVASALAGATPGRAQTQPPPFGQGGPMAPPAPSPARPPAPPAPAQASKPDARPPAPVPRDDEIDDPKVSRRLGTRISVPPPPPPPAPPPATARPAAPPPPAQPVAPLPPARLSPESEAADTQTLVHPYTPPAEAAFQPTPPRLKLGLRHFNFIRIGASQTPDGIAATETFNSLGVDVYPVSNVIRIGLTTAFGWQSGTGLLDGDYFATQSFSFGGQYRDLGHVVPFAEAFTGVGYMRRLQFDRTIPTAFWQFGADAGVEVYVARTGYLSLALGYLRPVNGFAVRQQFTSVFVDTWSLKLGIGI